MLTDLSQEMDRQQSIVKETAQRTEAAIKALDNESRCSAMRERNKAVRRAIRVIEVWFAPISASDPRKTGQIRNNTTKVVQVKIVPVVGEPRAWKRGDDESTDSRARSRGRD